MANANADHKVNTSESQAIPFEIDRIESYPGECVVLNLHHT
jgi:hypothetical protein